MLLKWLFQFPENSFYFVCKILFFFKKVKLFSIKKLRQNRSFHIERVDHGSGKINLKIWNLLKMFLSLSLSLSHTHTHTHTHTHSLSIYLSCIPSYKIFSEILKIDKFSFFFWLFQLQMYHFCYNHNKDKNIWLYFLSPFPYVRSFIVLNVFREWERECVCVCKIESVCVFMGVRECSVCMREIECVCVCVSVKQHI